MNELCARIYTGFMLVALVISSFFYAPLLLSAFFVLSFCWILFVEFPALCRPNRWLWLLALLYPLFPFCLLLYFNHSSYRLLLLLSMGLISLADSSAYFIGKKWGFHKIAPRISPGKSWEGVSAAWVATASVLAVIQWWQRGFCDVFFIVWFSALFVAMGFGGDLFESYLKRNAGLKDSGSCLPGHGGLLDRFDALLFVIILVFVLRAYLCVKLCL